MCLLCCAHQTADAGKAPAKSECGIQQHHRNDRDPVPGKRDKSRVGEREKKDKNQGKENGTGYSARAAHKSETDETEE